MNALHKPFDVLFPPCPATMFRPEWHVWLHEVGEAIQLLPTLMQRWAAAVLVLDTLHLRAQYVPTTDVFALICDAAHISHYDLALLAIQTDYEEVDL